MATLTKKTMRYKTTIKLITEASDKDEAMEIAGEYLSGNLSSGVEMKLRATPVNNTARCAGLIAAFVAIVALVAAQGAYVKCSHCAIQNLPGDSVIQPPLKTSAVDSSYSDFQKEWQVRHTKEALDSAKR